MRNTIKNITFFAALALMSVSCVEDKMGGYINDGVIRYDLDNTAPVVAKSSQDAEELSPIVLTSEDGNYSITLQRSVSPTAQIEAASKAAPVSGMSLKENYNPPDCGIQGRQPLYGPAEAHFRQSGSRTDSLAVED